MKKTVTAGVASTAMAAALMFGFGLAIARADVLDDLAQEFTTAAGGGQVSNLLNTSLKLRASGFKPTPAELDGITKALGYRPNQRPLIDALQTAVDGQNKRMKQAQQLAGGQGPYTIGINQYDPNSPGGVTAGPGGINVGGGATQIGDGRAPGQAVGPPG